MGTPRPCARVTNRLLLVAATLAALAFLVPSRPAAAQEHDYTETIREALAEFDSGHFEESLALFRLAHSLRPSARTLRGLGNASFELRHYVDAVGYYRDALASTENPLTDEQRTEVDRLLARARVFVGGYRLAVTPAGASVTIDAAAVAGTDVLLSIGDHTVSVSAPGYTTRAVPVTVRGGEDETLTIVLEPATASAGTPVLGTGVGAPVVPQGVIAPPAGVIAPPPPAEVHVRVESRSPGLVLHASLDGASMMPVCAAPCEATLRGGNYSLGVSAGAGSARPAPDGRIRLDHDATLGLVYEDRDSLRVAGGVTIGVGLLVGLGLVIAGAAIGSEGYDQESVLGLVVTGSLLIPITAIVGFILAVAEDEVSVRELGAGVRF